MFKCKTRYRAGSTVNWRQPSYNNGAGNNYNIQRNQRGEAETAIATTARSQYQAQQQQQQQKAKEPEYQLQPYSALPEHIRNLIYQAYIPQGPYVDPSAFIYNTNVDAQNQQHQQEQDNQQSTQTIQPTYQYQQSPPAPTYQPTNTYVENSNKLYNGPNNQQAAGVVYKDEQQQNNNQDYQGGSGYDMPMAIRQILHFQSQIPYNVIANHILYRPKAVFVPKPLPDDVKGTQNYRSRIYYLKDDVIEEED